MDESFSCEAVGSLVVVRLKHSPTERLLAECQLCVLETMQEASSTAVLYDLTAMEPAPINVLLYQQLLNSHVAHLRIRRAILVPNTQIAHLARLAFGDGDYRVFYGDAQAATRFLHAARSTSSDWSTAVIEERRVRERRATSRGPVGRRERDRAPDSPASRPA